MEEYISKKVLEIKPSGIRRFFDLAMGVEGAVKLSVGEPDFQTPSHISKVGIDAINKGNTFYTANAGLLELRKEIASYLDRRYHAHYEEDEILVTVGGSEAIDLAFRLLLNPGDEVILSNPGYVSYEPCAQMVGANSVYIDVNEENGFKITPEALEKVITPRSKILVLNYPNNPTGATMTSEDYLALKDIILKYNLFVVTDEVYGELIYDGEPTSIASIPELKDHVILINGFSKAYAMTGWRLGYLCANKTFIKQMIKIHQYTTICVSTISQYAGIEALKNGDEDIITMREAYRKRREYLLKRFKEMGLPCYEPKGAFYCFVNISKYGLTSEEFALRLAYEGKVIVIPGTAFGSNGEGFLRISYAYSLEALEEGCNRLAKFIESISQK